MLLDFDRFHSCFHMHACLTGTRLSPVKPHTHTRTHSPNSTSPGLGIEEPEIPFRSQVLRSSTHLNRTSFPSPTPFDTLDFFQCTRGHFSEIGSKPTYTRALTYTLIHARTHARIHTYTICSVYRLFRAGIAAVEKTKLIVLRLQ